MSATRSFEGSSPCSAPVSTIWQVWTTPSAWPGGIIESASIDGDFVVGAKYTTKVKGLPASTGTVTHVESPRIWGSVAKAPGLTLTYEHIIEPNSTGAVLTERAIMTGPLAGVAALLIGKRLESTFAATTAHCAQLAESRVR
jgi:hypothetical protein